MLRCGGSVWKLAHLDRCLHLLWIKFFTTVFPLCHRFHFFAPPPPPPLFLSHSPLFFDTAIFSARILHFEATQHNSNAVWWIMWLQSKECAKKKSSGGKEGGVGCEKRRGKKKWKTVMKTIHHHLPPYSNRTCGTTFEDFSMLVSPPLPHCDVS